MVRSSRTPWRPSTGRDDREAGDGSPGPEPRKPREDDLDELIRRITPENIHDAVDWGAPLGKEVW
jgi:hypothetical protein